jgi:hypothetical protein
MRSEFEDEQPQKKEFLKRKSQKAPVSVPTKKYNYYVDNFEETKKKDRSTSKMPDETPMATVTPAIQSAAFSKQQSVDSSNPTNRAVSPIDNQHDRYHQ